MYGWEAAFRPNDIDHGEFFRVLMIEKGGLVLIFEHLAMYGFVDVKSPFFDRFNEVDCPTVTVSKRFDKQVAFTVALKDTVVEEDSVG